MSRGTGGSRRRGCLGWAGRALVALVLLLIVFLAIAGFRGSRAKAALRAQYPPPGQLVDVGGYRLHIHCQGSGSPTVVLAPGAGDFSLSWVRLQPAVARLTRVCAYDPSGFGWSELGPEPPTPSNTVEELRALLAGAGIEPPYVLVGHSISGLHVRAYAYRHPEEVAGLVLVDSSHEDQVERVKTAVAERTGEAGGSTPTDKINAWAQSVVLAVLDAQQPLGLLALSPQLLAGAALPPVPENVLDEYRGVMFSSDTYFTALRRQSAYGEETMAEMREWEGASLGDLPLVVLSARKTVVPPGFALSAEEMLELQAAMHAELAALSTRGELVPADGSAHFVHLDQPELVLEAIERVIGE